MCEHEWTGTFHTLIDVCRICGALRRLDSETKKYTYTAPARRDEE